MAEGDTPATGPLTLDQAVANYADSQEQPEQPAAEALEAETSADEIVDEADEEAEAPEAVEDPEEGQTQSDEEAQVLTVDEYGDVLIQDGDQALTLSQILEDRDKGTLRQADYTRKTQATAAREKELDAREAELAAKQQQLDAAFLESGQNDPEPDWVQVMTDDPIDGPRQKAEWEARDRDRKAKQAEAEQRSEARIREFQQFTRAKALEVIPEWGENGGYEKGEPARREVALKAGFSLEEYNGALDARMAVLLEMAAKGMATSKEGKAVEKRVASAPRVLKPGRQKTAGDRKADAAAAKQRKLSRPHTIEDALRAHGL